TADNNIPIRHSRELHAANPATTELWEVTGAGHVDSFGRDPEAYARRVTVFFAAHRVPK
ncbi:MAG: alpha/beta hydrolase, partial [Acidobacteria bacterium]|nr:alpha/beta hydrolase [Acidobacteriota bacterium]